MPPDGFHPLFRCHAGKPIRPLKPAPWPAQLPAAAITVCFSGGLEQMAGEGGNQQFGVAH